MAFDLLSFLLGKSTGSGGGGGSAALGPKTIRQNGVYRASSDNLDGYNAVTVEVPNSYAAADEGKVVSNGALVAQTSRTITENGTYDTTLNDEVVVNVSGGEGISIDDIAKNLAPSGAITLGGSVTEIAECAFYAKAGITSVSGAEVTTISPFAFRYCAGLTAVNFPKVTRIGTTAASKTDEYVFYGSKISTFYLPNLLTAHGYYTLAGLGDPTHKCTLVLPKLISESTAGANDNNMFRGGHFAAADFGPDYAYITDASFYSGSIAVLILRRTESVVTAYNALAINDIKANTEVYVPSTLIEDYKAAPLWSTKPVSIWHSLEGSPYEHYYANGVAVA